MENFKNALLGVFLLLIATGFAQEYKFGKVSKEELSETAYPLDKTANAAILYENKNIYIKYIKSQGFQLITEVVKRIKLYNKDGFEYASDEVFLYKRGSDEERITDLKGTTYTLSEGKIVETKLKKDGIFKSKYSENYEQQKFTMPALKEGSVIEYKYKIISPFFSRIDRIYLQQEIPIKRLDVKVESPEYFTFKKFSTGYLPVNLKESKRSDRIVFTNSAGGGSVDNYGRRTASQSRSSQSSLDFSVNTSKIFSRNVPAFVVEPFSGNVENYISAISYELSFVNFPGEPIKYYSTTWEDVVKTIYASNNFGDELKKKSYYQEDLKTLLSGISDEEEKISKVFDYVKNRMVWNNKYRVGTTVGVKKAYKEKTGNAAEINLMLTSMLTSAGLDANPVLVSTSNRVTALFPTLDGFNYVITRVKLSNGKLIYLDATDKYGLPNILPDRVTRGEGRVIGANNTSQRVDLRPKKPSLIRYSMQCEINGEGEVKGKFNVRHMDYLAHRFRVMHSEKDDESKVKRFKKKFEIDEIEEYSVKGIDQYGKGISESFNFAAYDQVELIENEMYFSPLLFLRDKENLFKSDKRDYPIDFGHGFTNAYMLNIKIPEGYQVAELPEAGVFKLPEDTGAFTFRSNVANGVIQIIANETINKAVITPDFYLTLKQFYNQLVEKENQQVVLKKI